MNKHIPDFPKYSINELGEVYRGDRKLTPSLNRKRGYYYVAVQDGNNRRKNYILHRIIALLFIPNPENKPCINHKNGIKSDNRIENLEWCTFSENQKHAFKNGLTEPSRGEKCGMSKLKREQVLEIRELGDKHTLTHREIAKKYNIGTSTVTHIVLRSRWGWL